MKLVLSESQARFIVEEYTSRALAEAINESISGEQIASWIKKAVITGVSAAAILAGIAKTTLSDDQKAYWTDYVKEMLHLNPVDETPEAEETNNGISEEMQAKIDATKECMSRWLKKQGKTLDDIDLDPQQLVMSCEEYGFNIAFALAQGWHESWWGLGDRCRVGTKGNAPTHSV